MNTTQINLEDDLLAILQQLNQPLEQSIRELMVLELYRRGQLSSGKAAALLGMARADFLQHASKLGIPYLALTEEEWERERAQSETL